MQILVKTFYGSPNGFANLNVSVSKNFREQYLQFKQNTSIFLNQHILQIIFSIERKTN